MGALSGIRLTEQQQRSHQRNLLLARATGGPPWLDPAEVRALIAVRLRTFLSGDAGVSADLCQRLADLLDEGIIPAVPRDGSGSAGEIIPLAHAFGPLAGIGQVLGAAGPPARPRPHCVSAVSRCSPSGPRKESRCRWRTGRDRAVGAARGRGRQLAHRMEAAAALSIVAARAPADPYQPECARGDDVLGGVLGRIRQAIGTVGGAGPPPSGHLVPRRWAGPGPPAPGPGAWRPRPGAPSTG